MDRSLAEPRELITAIKDMSCREDGLFVFVVAVVVVDRSSMMGLKLRDRNARFERALSINKEIPENSGCGM